VGAASAAKSQQSGEVENPIDDIADIAGIAGSHRQR
jgi:hypothetical protein